MNDDERLSQGPTFQLIGSRKVWERGVALTSRLQSFETAVLTPEDNLGGLAALNRELIARAAAINSSRRVVLVGQRLALSIAVKDSCAQTRWSKLKQWLRDS